MRGAVGGGGAPRTFTTPSESPVATSERAYLRVRVRAPPRVRGTRTGRAAHAREGERRDVRRVRRADLPQKRALGVVLIVHSHALVPPDADNDLVLRAVRELRHLRSERRARLLCSTMSIRAHPHVNAPRPCAV